MFIANSYRCHDIVHRHAALLAVAVEETTLSYEVLFSISQQHVINAVERIKNRFIRAIVELAGFELSFKATKKAKYNFARKWGEATDDLHLFLWAFQMLEELQCFTESQFRWLGGSVSLDSFELINPMLQLHFPVGHTLFTRGSVNFDVIQWTERWNVQHCCVEIRVWLNFRCETQWLR